VSELLLVPGNRDSHSRLSCRRAEGGYLSSTEIIPLWPGWGLNGDAIGLWRIDGIDRRLDPCGVTFRVSPYSLACSSVV
jgi:hypothetical protein